MTAEVNRVPIASLHFLLLLCSLYLLPQCSSQELNATLTSTESTITLAWNVEANASFYQVTWHRTIGIFFIDAYYEEPFENETLVYRTEALFPGVSYTFLLFRNGNHSSDKIFHGEVFTVPLPPENLNVVNRTSTSVLLTWEPGYNSSQSHYEVDYQADGSIQTEVVNMSADPLTFNLTGLMPGHTYLLTMRAVSGNERSNNSATVSAVTAPAMPEDLNVTATSTSTLLATWEAGNNSLQDSFEVEYTLEGDSTPSITNCTESPCEFSVSGEPGQLYTVSVYAVKQSFRSEPAVVQHNTAPAAARNLDAVSGVRTLELTWEVPARGVFDSFRVSFTNAFVSSEISYQVQKQGDSSVYSYSPTGLEGGVNYFVRVYSVTATEESKDFASHLYYTLPESVTNLIGQALNTSALQLSWQNPFNTQYTGLELNVTSDSGVAMSYIMSAGDSTFPVGGLDPGVEYTAVVVVKSKVQVDSAPVNTTVRTKPESPLLVTAVSEEESIELTLSGGQNPQGVFDSIKARLVEEGTLLTADSQGLIKFSSLTPGTQYMLDSYTMSGIQTSESLMQTLYTKPRPPQDLSIEAVSSQQLLITWAPPDRGGVDNYTVTLVPSHGAETPKVYIVSVPTFTFTEAHPGETYNVSVVARKGTEFSEAAVEQNTTTPLPLMHVRVSMKGTDFAVISWDMPSGSVFDGFAYDFPFTNETLVELPADPLNVRFESLDPKSNYTVTLYVFSRRVDGSLLYSEPISFNFSTYPESVAALQKVNATSDTITVNWTAPVSGRFSMYQLGINPRDSPTFFAAANLTEHTFETLKPGKNYTVAIRTVITRTSFGEAVYLRAVTKPLPVAGLTLESLGANALNVSWTVDALSNQDRFTIVQEKDDIRKTQQLSATPGQLQYQETLDQLLAGHMYTITVTAIREIDSDIEESLPQAETRTTNPLPVVNITVTENNQIVTVTWQTAAGSKQDKYRFMYRSVLRDTSAHWLEQTAVTEATQFSGAFPGEMYEISIIAISNEQESVPSNTSVVIAPLPPSVSIDRTATTTNRVKVAWTHDPSASYVEYWVLTYTSAQTSQSHNITFTSTSNDYSQDLSPLTPGVTYTVEVMAVVRGVMSEMVILNATARPIINTVIVEIPSETTNTDLSFEYRESPDIFDTFRFSLVGISNVTPVEKSKEDTDRRVRFTGLQGGQVYTVEAVTISAGEVSDPVTKNILTMPNNVNVNFVNRSEELVVNFADLDGRATMFNVSCVNPSGSSCWSEKVPSTSTSVTINNLLPYTVYNITVKTTAGGPDVSDKHVLKSYSVQTAEAAPSAVRQVTVAEDGLRTVELSWMEPVAQNGVLKSYHVEYTGTHPLRDPDVGEPVQTSATKTSLKLMDLKAGFTYTFTVKAMTVALGAAGEASITLSTDKPAFEPGINTDNSKPTNPTGNVISETSFSVELINAFSDQNGPVLGYTVIVSKDPNADTTQNMLPSWSTAYSDESVSVYQATEMCPDLFQLNSACGKSSARSKRAASGESSVVFQLGAQPASACGGVQFCNGPLKAETDYYVKLRAHTEAGFTDTAYSSKIRTADEVKSSSAVIIGAVVGVVIFLIIIAIVIFVVIRIKRRPKRATKYRGSTRAAHSSWDNSTLKHFSRPVKLRDFPEHVHKMAADSDFKYAEEYEDLKEVGRDQTCHAAEMPANRPKNRFTNILPYDHSRVKLLPTDDEDGSDYINANYMPGFTSKREYIATQGPLPATRDDFWRMAWEQNARNIVMLTRCMEKGREKSDHYWPTDSEPKYYGDLQVVILNETHLPDWTITEFRMCLGDNCRQVRHFHYKAWPDFGVPKNHSSLIRFVRTVREKLIKEGGPIVTHCSAGVGRSGTFIVLDHCLQLIREKDEVDIFSIVYSLRRERVLMVQTEQQYKFVHECLSCVLEGREDEATYANIGQVNVGFEDDEGINVEVPT